MSASRGAQLTIAAGRVVHGDNTQGTRTYTQEGARRPQEATARRRRRVPSSEAQTAGGRLRGKYLRPHRLGGAKGGAVGTPIASVV
jgi:hypothetical protein